MTTPYHSKYFAYELTKRCSAEKLEKLSQSLFNATVDLNPHQIEAALFAFRSPLSRGAILADEVGLGKTIEAGLIISQLWAEKRRRILCITPAALRTQWAGELAEKFFTDSLILETKNFNQLSSQGIPNPFIQSNKVVICSYQFAKLRESELKAVLWDLVVVDEAHRLRNVYKKSNVIARTIRGAIGTCPKVLLTATPLQNSLMELYGLISFIDPHIFGSEDSFREQFAKRGGDLDETEFSDLKSRIRPICQRTLRRQVTEYIRYTNRVPITQDFTPTDDEIRLYESVSAYLQRPESYALPKSQRSLMTLVLRKILASSSFAIAATLEAMAKRLEAAGSALVTEAQQSIADAVADDYDAADEVTEEWTEPEDESEPAPPIEPSKEELVKAQMLQAMRSEASELRNYQTLAQSITSNAKGEALLISLNAGLMKANKLGAPKKALIFTESRRTQRYLKDLLETNGYGGQIVTLSGTNTDADSKTIYANWIKRHVDDDCVTHSQNVDMRTALIEEFRDRATILIATESGAEGLNLQFCSLVVNYDLPWNPQRIEQRIGRCHRYGQQHDVVVINFLNRRNAADQRVFELLAEKLRLFDGVFGSSDEILGALGSGVDFEKRIHEIYQSCRTPSEINSAFDRLQAELDEQIRAQMEDARAKLLDNFDEDIHRRFRTSRDMTELQVDLFGSWLWRLTEYELRDCAEFNKDQLLFELRRMPSEFTDGTIPLGRYRLVTHRDGTGDHHYRLGHPLAEEIIGRAKSRQLPIREVVFHYSDHPTKVSPLESLTGHSGWLRFSVLSVHALEIEDHLIMNGVDDDGASLDTETCSRLFAVSGDVRGDCELQAPVEAVLTNSFETSKTQLVGQIAERNRTYFESEMEKLEVWADDLKVNLERDLRELDKEIKAAKRDARQAADLETKVSLHKKAKELEKRRSDKRRGLFEAQDEIDTRKDRLIQEIEGRLKAHTESGLLFSIRWRVE